MFHHLKFTKSSISVWLGVSWIEGDTSWQPQIINHFRVKYRADSVSNIFRFLLKNMTLFLSRLRNVNFFISSILYCNAIRLKILLLWLSYPLKPGFPFSFSCELPLPTTYTKVPTSRLTSKIVRLFYWLNGWYTFVQL